MTPMQEVLRLVRTHAAGIHAIVPSSHTLEIHFTASPPPTMIKRIGEMPGCIVTTVTGEFPVIQCDG